MSVKFMMVMVVVTTLIGLSPAAGFDEGWDTSPIGMYTPTSTSFIHGDQGYWFLGDTVSEFSDCGPTPQRGEILNHGGSRALRLTSNNSYSDCADNVWVALADYGVYNRGFSVPIGAETVISFAEEGELVDPGLHGWGKNCLVPPCFDNVSILLTDNRGNILAYVLQRYSGATANVSNYHYGDTYREIFLDPEAGTYVRNLRNDFSTVPTFNPTGAAITSIEFKVDEHGWAIIDNIIIGEMTVVSIEATDSAAAEEGPDTGEFTVTRTGPTTAPLVVTYTVAGSATAGSDYNALSNSVTIPLGASAATIDVIPVDDNIGEGPETVEVSLAAGAGYVRGSDVSAEVIIADNDGPAVTVTASDASAAEEGLDPGEFTVTRTGPTDAALTVYYRMGGAAIPDADYVALPGAITIPSGSTSQSIAVTPIDDAECERSETVRLTLLPDQAYSLPDSLCAHVIIRDNDAFAGAQDYPVGDYPAGLAAADFNSDGLPDLVVANQYSHSVTVLYGQPAGGFGSGADFSVGSYPLSVATADLNNDGLVDLVTANSEADTLSLLYGQSGGGFGGRQDIATLDSPGEVIAGFLNGDALPDIAVTNNEAASVSIFYGQAAGGLSTRVDVAVGDFPEGIASADLDNDSVADLAVVNWDDNSVSVLYGLAGGGFANPVDMAVGNDPHCLVLGDLKRDNRLDLVVTNGDSSPDIITALYADAGDRGYSTRKDFPAGNQPCGIAGGDFNRDGRFDVAVTNWDDDDVSIFYGQAGGLLGDRQDYPAGDAARRVIAHDLNKDGLLDLAIANYWADTVTILYGQDLPSCFAPVHRFWSPTLKRHFYTITDPERTKLIDKYGPVWTHEDIAYYAFTDDSEPGTSPVYRFWSGKDSAHVYTISEAEKQKLIDNYSHVLTFEGPAFYAFSEGSQPQETLPVYRFWSDGKGCHFYTMSEREKNKLIDNYSHVWTFEGIAWYAYE